MARLSLNRKKVYSATALVFIGWSAGLSVLLLAIAWVFLRNQIRPVLRLARAANTFGLHNQQTWLRPQGAQEIRTAIVAFNRMQERILQHLEQRTIMLAGISHDLRTPLTRLRLQLGLLEDDLPADSRTDMLADVQDMETMVNSYLAFARGDTHEDSEAVPLAAWLEDTLSPWRKQENVHLQLPDNTLKVLMQPQAMRRAVANVVDNALQYGTAVWIDVTSGSDGTVRLSVADNGCGIPPEQYDNALKPFFRLNTARPSTQGHVGLGLAVAQQIVQQQPGGSLSLAKAAQGGLMVVVGLQNNSVTALRTLLSTHPLGSNDEIMEWKNEGRR
jgi:two-component system osmolarity sensor histidine kinase EnvZ